jgi:hypothetical protein
MAFSSSRSRTNNPLERATSMKLSVVAREHAAQPRWEIARVEPASCT